MSLLRIVSGNMTFFPYKNMFELLPPDSWFIWQETLYYCGKGDYQ